MAYAVMADMVARFGELEVIQLTDRNQDGYIDEDVAAVALADATAEIDAYLGRFKRPFADVPPILKRLCCDIARYRLTAANGVLITEEIRNRYKIDVLDLLRAMAKGEVQLGVDDSGEEVAAGEDGIVFVNGKNKVFGRDH
ncbi:gp436 family protein [Neisseria weaveri]|uniref:gp436 family protein n=1 Tax=Neisseria weaveri TaxID=28091 RepID=UPI000D30EDA0|nr:phage protein Gp36 family protein [Neisseria weaveri]